MKEDAMATEAASTSAFSLKEKILAAFMALGLVALIALVT
jgi:hypothetical protein